MDFELSPVWANAELPIRWRGNALTSYCTTSIMGIKRGVFPLPCSGSRASCADNCEAAG